MSLERVDRQTSYARIVGDARAQGTPLAAVQEIVREAVLTDGERTQLAALVDDLYRDVDELAEIREALASIDKLTATVRRLLGIVP